MLQASFGGGSRFPENRHCRNALTGTPLARLRQPAQWGAYAHLLCDVYRPVVKMVAQPELKLSKATVFRWHHRFLEGVQWFGYPVLSRVVEADESFFLRSFKGSRGWIHDQPPIDRSPRRRGGRLRLKGTRTGLLVLVQSAVDRNG